MASDAHVCVLSPRNVGDFFVSSDSLETTQLPCDSSVCVSAVCVAAMCVTTLLCYSLLPCWVIVCLCWILGGVLQSSLLTMFLLYLPLSPKHEE